MPEDQHQTGAIQIIWLGWGNYPDRWQARRAGVATNVGAGRTELAALKALISRERGEPRPGLLGRLLGRRAS